ncbi:MAG: hypothetical protein US94_C0029G0001 [Berkelbacteria bacterium GW2011_GWB1_38_5]|uniref:Uncharacterized protein n=1 Tax=Berkelbacteria bacterium GW2011_GWB1_38_5 TaxID=1618336 RepID=A0A0G0N990_9BACT|nr:MAG: hypothetical protein US94_C0029G0001 [Berkelbacteria bacterium GW2011_GWB1_38_5]
MAREEKRRQRILATIKTLGGRVTTGKIAQHLGLDFKIVAKSLETLRPFVQHIGGKNASAIWELTDQSPES